MRITPLDVRKQEFKRGMRGYDGDEVRAFLSTLADEYEAVLVDNKQLRERVVEQDEKLGEFRTLEQTLRDTLMTAERVTQDAKETALKEGEVVVQQARQRAERVLAEGRERLNELRREALAVHREKEAFLGRFRSLAEAQIHFVEQHRQDFVDLDARLLEQADSVPTRRRNAAPNQPQRGTMEDTDRAPAPRARNARDEWRDYAIASAEQVAAGAAARVDVEHIAEVVQQAEQTVQAEEVVQEAAPAVKQGSEQATEQATEQVEATPAVTPAPNATTEDVQRT